MHLKKANHTSAATAAADIEVGTKSILLIIQQAKKGTPLAMEVSSTADEVFIAKCLISLMIPLQ